MILNIRGASGSGKSTLARHVMDAALRRAGGRCVLEFADGRRRPVGYRYTTSKRSLVVLGHYEIANGGMDTVELDEGYRMIREWAGAGWDVLYEGKTLRDRASSVIDLSHYWPTRVLHLTTPLDECVRRIRQRVGPTGRPHNIAPRSVEAMALKCARDADKLRAGSVSCLSVTLEQAMPLALEILRL